MLVAGLVCFMLSALFHVACMNVSFRQMKHAKYVCYVLLQLNNQGKTHVFCVKYCGKVSLQH